jgi:cysteine desulfurase
VLDVVVTELRQLGNASSDHPAGRRAKAVVQFARNAVADLLNADPGEITFTSGATEANNLAILGLEPDGFRPTWPPA